MIKSNSLQLENVNKIFKARKEEPKPVPKVAKIIISIAIVVFSVLSIIFITAAVGAAVISRVKLNFIIASLASLVFCNIFLVLDLITMIFFLVLKKRKNVEYYFDKQVIETPCTNTGKETWYFHKSTGTIFIKDDLNLNKEYIIARRNPENYDAHYDANIAIFGKINSKHDITIKVKNFLLFGGEIYSDKNISIQADNVFVFGEISSNKNISIQADNIFSAGKINAKEKVFLLSNDLQKESIFNLNNKIIKKFNSLNFGVTLKKIDKNLVMEAKF